MPNGEDWLEDPLAKIKQRSYKPRKLKSSNDKQHDRWKSFHFATRLKLDGADHFCRQALGAASMSYDLGLPLLAHRQLEWYLGAFFFELMSAYDTLLQELNIVYAYDMGLKLEKVHLDTIKGKLPEELAEYMDKQLKEKWFSKVRWYRNTATHHYLVPVGSGTVGFGEQPLDYSEHETHMVYLDGAGNIGEEEIKACIEYLKNMVRYISSVWGMMAQEFQ